MQRNYGKIVGWGKYAPERVLTNAEIETFVDTSDEWITRRTGIKQRHMAAAHETSSSMAIEAGRKALEMAGMTPADLDLIILGSTTEDYFCPAASSLVQAGLGAPGTPAFVVNTGCTAFVYALSTGYQFIHSGAYRNVMVIGSELLSRAIDWNDRSTCVLFGDGAGAVIIQATDEPCGLYGFNLGSEGEQGDAIVFGNPVPGWSVPREGYPSKTGAIMMNGQKVFRFATKVMGQASGAALADAGMSLDDIDVIIPHQANLRIIQAAARDMGLPMEKFVVRVQDYGNTSAASIPLALVDGLESGQIKPTDRMLLVAFGAGLTWAAAVVQMVPVPEAAATSVDEDEFLAEPAEWAVPVVGD